MPNPWEMYQTKQPTVNPWEIYQSAKPVNPWEIYQSRKNTGIDPREQQPGYDSHNSSIGPAPSRNFLQRGLDYVKEMGASRRVILFL